MVKWLFWSCLLLMLYSYAVYPLILAAACCLQRLLRRKASEVTDTGEEWPRVTMLVAAYNEAAVIQEKIDNSLALDYPADRLRVVIASDGSSDATNSLVAACSDPRIQLRAYEQRIGWRRRYG